MCNMKKRAWFGVLIIFLMFSCVSFVIAQDNETDPIDDAYNCLEEKVEDKCSSLSSEEKIFSLLAIQECEDEVLSDSSYKSNVKLTAQAVLALNKVNVDTDDAVEWLLSQNTTPQNIDWYLEIDSSEAIECTITYDGSSHTINIGEDKKIDSNAGRCLSLAQKNYWFRVSPSCHTTEFEISCNNLANKDFLTTLLFKKAGSNTYHISDDTNTASAGGATVEKINSFCFAQGTSCDYEASLWTASVLNYLGEDVYSYLPYLIIMADDYEEYLPEAFLIYFDGFRTELLNKQYNEGYWRASISGDKFYDTALALYPFQSETFQQKTNAKEWLLEIQDTDGCWKGGNIRDTAFILHSIWPRDFYIPDDNGEEIDCIEAGYHCMSSMSCQDAGGSELHYYCSGLYAVCCDQEIPSETCVASNGEICSSTQTCTGEEVDASDLDYGQTCCLGGTCEEREEETECEQYFGICRAYGCEEGEEEDLYDCDYGDICCVEKVDEPEMRGYWWIWVLLSLIFLVVLGIIFRNKLRPLWMKIKSKFGKGKSKARPRGGPRPRFPPAPPGMLPRRLMPRRILPPAQRQPIRRPIARRPKGEVSDVLKKLKEMGK